MSIKKKRQRLLKHLAKNEGKKLIRRVKYEYKTGRPSYNLDNYELSYIDMTQADKLIRDYLNKQGIKFEAKNIVKHIPLPGDHTVDRIYYDFIDEEN